MCYNRYGRCFAFQKPTPCKQLTTLLYSKVFHNTTARAHVWRSPAQQTYYTRNAFLPLINNEIGADERRRSNFLSIRQLHLFASDGGLFTKPTSTPHHRHSP